MMTTQWVDPRARVTIRTLLTNNESRFILILSLLAATLLLTTLFWALVFPLTPGRLTKPSAALFAELPLWSIVGSIPFPMLQSRWFVALCLVVVSLVGFACYGCAVFLCWNRPPRRSSLAVVVSGAVLSFAVAAYALPNIDTDIYNYIVSARVATEHQSNPYYVAPDRFPGDPIYPYASKQYTDAPDNKLPAWMLFSMFLTRIAGDDPITNLLVFRLALLAVNIANIALIVAILRSLSPRNILAGVALYGWNPIVILRGESKTDTIMVFLLLLAILMQVAGRERTAVVPLALAGFVKLLTMPLLALYWVRELSLRRWRFLVAEMLLAALTVVVIYLPFLNEPGLIVNHLAFVSEGGAVVPAAMRPFAVVLFLALLVGAGLWQDGSTRRLLYGSAVLLLFFALFLTRVQYSWYMMVPVAVISLVRDWRMAILAIASSFASFLFNAWEATSTGSFLLPHVYGFTRFFVYLAVVALITCGIAMMVTRGRMPQRRQLGRAE